MDPAEDNGDRPPPARQVQLPPVPAGESLLGAIIRGAGVGAATAPFLWRMAALTGLGKASVGAAIAALIAGVIAGAAVAAVAWLIRKVVAPAGQAAEGRRRCEGGVGRRGGDCSTLGGEGGHHGPAAQAEGRGEGAGNLRQAQ